MGTCYAIDAPTLRQRLPLSDTDDEVWHRRVDDEGYEEIEV